MPRNPQPTKPPMDRTTMMDGCESTADPVLSNNQVKVSNTATKIREKRGTHPESIQVPSVVTDADSSLDMSLALSAKGLRMVVNEGVKSVLFPKLKFFVKETHGEFDNRPATVCGLMLQYCNVTPDDARVWWRENKLTIAKCHTSHRNNCIKSIKLRYKGKCPFVKTVIWWCSF